MSPVDHAWFRMDTAENLMVVNAIMWTDEPVDEAAVRSKIESMIQRFPKFRRHPVPALIPFGRANWRDDEDFDLDRHLLVHHLEGGLDDYVSAQIPVALDPAHPMWQIHLIVVTVPVRPFSSGCTTASPTASRSPGSCCR